MAVPQKLMRNAKNTRLTVNRSRLLGMLLEFFKLESRWVEVYFQNRYLLVDLRFFGH